MADAYKLDGETVWDNRIVGHGEAAAGDLLANPDNFRIHGKIQQDVTAGSLNDLGWVKSVVVNTRTGRIVDGHLRVTLAMRKGEDTLVPVEYVDLSESKEAQALASLDYMAGLAGIDPEKLNTILHEIETPDSDLQQMLADMAEEAGITGFGDDGMESLDAEPQTDRAEELRQKWGVEIGQMWRLPSRTEGQEHRLICEDCTDRDVVDRVMGREKASSIITDPPYNLASHNTLYAKDAPTQQKTYKALSESDWDKNFDIKSIWNSLLFCSGENCSIYIFTSSHMAPDIWEFMNTHCRYNSYCIWAKPNPAPSLSKKHWTWATELVCYGVIGSPVFNFPSSGHALSYWEFTSPSHTTSHPTEKPVKIVEHPMKHHSQKGDIVVDLFLGSGTTMIASENLARQCRAVEIDPKFVSVALQRYEDTFGITPELIG